MRRFFIALLTLLVLLSFARPVSAGTSIRIYYAGPQKNSVYTALTLAPRGTFTFVNNPTQADVVVLNGIIPDPAVIAAQVQRGAGLVLILGPEYIRCRSGNNQRHPGHACRKDRCHQSYRNQGK